MTDDPARLDGSDDDHEADDPVLDGAPAPEDASAVEEAAQKQLGIRIWERPALYRETAEAATDTDLPFFAVLLLSGAIATLGLVLNSTAVVIGAMLVAPLLGPLLGLSMSLAVGDGRLFVQTAAAVLLGALGIVALAAALTALLPVQTVTDEIASRTRPNTLDLGIAIFSGLAGAVVTASREARLSASIPGVAVAVALVPPLGVAGFGIAAGQWSITQGALLLFGANLAGIALSGMGVFLLIGMHRSDVVEAAREWHDEGHATGVARRISGAQWLDRLPGLASPLARVLTVVAFMAVVAWPLTTSFGTFIREARIGAAVGEAEQTIEAGGDAFVLDRETAYGDESTTVRLRVATTRWISDAREAELSAVVSRGAEEPVTLVLEQVLASSGDLDAFAAALPSQPSARSASVATPETAATALATLRGRLADALGAIDLPDGARLVRGAVEVTADGGAPTVTLVYGAREPMSRDAEELVARQAASALGLPRADGRTRFVRLGRRPLPDSTEVGPLAGALAQNDRLRLTLAGDTTAVRTARARLLRAGAPLDRLTTLPDTLASRALLSIADSTGR